MYHWKYFYFFVCIHLTIGIPHINLYYTDESTGNHYILPHTCLYMLVPTPQDKSYETARLCLSQLASSYKIENQHSFSKLTFDQLAKQNITSEQLYFWSAPMDLIERYQFYLNQLSNKTGDLSSAKDEYYDCTLPKFGPQCQYTFIYNISLYTSIEESIIDYYRRFYDEMTSFTCYINLKCNLTYSFMCLDWRNICDGKIDCIDNGLDEVDCWQLEIHECQENEFRCRNGQCVPRSFLQYINYGRPNCMDLSDLFPRAILGLSSPCFPSYFPSFRCEDLLYMNMSYYYTRRTGLALRTLYSKQNSLLLDKCSYAFICLLKLSDLNSCCQYEDCIEIIENSCPEIIYFPNVSGLFTNLHFIYKVNDSADWLNTTTAPFYICYDPSNYDLYFKNDSNRVINNMTCIDSRSLIEPWTFLHYSTEELYYDIIYQLGEVLHKYHINFNHNVSICNRSNMYQCENSVKCISMHRLMDNKEDCPYKDDENATITSTIHYLRKIHFNCYNGIYIHPFSIINDICECNYIDTTWCPDERLDITFLKTNIVFQHICDGFVDLMPILIDGRNESDETECEQWQCNNIYTHCNDILNCRNGADEAYCDQSDPSNCPSKWHQCISLHTSEFVCLSVEQLGDGIIDCLGATDEPDFCGYGLGIQSIPHGKMSNHMFYCMNFGPPKCVYFSSFCNGYNDCKNGTDEKFCTEDIIVSEMTSCRDQHENTSNIQRFLCNFRQTSRLWRIINFELHKIIENNSQRQLETVDNTLISNSFISQTLSETRLLYCHNGLDIDVWLDEQKHFSTNACLCPPSYYGDRCQYQSQRVSLTIQFQALAGSWRTPFAIIISLIDDSEQRLIHSYEQITYLSSIDCDYKFHKYLVYSTQPKDLTKNYSIHIDFYEKASLKYRGSALLPIDFPFLPIHYLSFIVDVPRIREDQTQICSIDRCDHGKCMRYANQAHNITFCQCHSGWSGRYCHVQHTCICSYDSLCVGISADNRSICVCPIDKFGSRCLLTDTICQKQSNSTCLNGGQCIANRHEMNFFQNFSCICPKNFTGDRCEIADVQLTIKFEKDIIPSQSIFFHFIEIISWTIENKNFTRRATTYRSIPFRQDSITVYWSEPFHLVFTELSNKNYYLTFIQNEYYRSSRIQRTVASSDRCPNISELFNQTFLQLHLLRRLKFYHLPCQNYSVNLSCFHDETYLCLCYDFQQQRAANCFIFDHQMEFDCSGRSECENGARCLQNKVNCPTKSWCICPPCYYGQLCQFSTSGSHSSLDGILGYHILPNVRFVNQPFIVKMSSALAIIFLVAGLIDVIFSLATFKNKTVNEFACGLYLLISSLTTLLTMILFGLKYFILLRTQMEILLNQSFFQVQCRSLDFLLRVSLSIDQWLYACVAVERTIMTIQGTGFNKKRSIKTVKFVIIILLIVIMCSYIHDPICRRVIQEENDLDDTKRTWCIVSYSTNLRVYNYVINIVHILGPFMINLISVIILIKVKTQQQSIVHPNRIYKQLLLEQLRELKHIIISPILLVILTSPRLITTFLSKCMQSSNDAWIYLIGYFISFIPTMLTFVIFVLPSQFYRVEFQNTIRQYRRGIQRCLNLNSYE